MQLRRSSIHAILRFSTICIRWDRTDRASTCLRGWTPIDPNVDPILVESMNALGTNTALEIGQTGKQGVLIHGVYDFWSPLRDYIALHNGLRVLTESASVDIASPIDIHSRS